MTSIQLFVSACRLYNISARLVISIEAVTNRISFSAEAFETTNGSWKSVDFSTMTYDGTKYDMLRTPKPLMPGAQVTCNERDECQHNNHLFVKRQNKLFIYKQQDELAIVTIVILRSQCAERVILNPVLFPFEAAELKVRLMQQTERKKQKGNIKDYIYVLGCNSKGWISELTPKHVERYSPQRGKNINTWLIRTIELINHKLKGLPEIGLVSLLERAEQKWMQTRVNNDPFPQTKAKFKNHPTYILASQIGNNRVRKKDATPLGYVKGEEVYLLSDFEDIKSRSAWLKVNRRVLDDATPVTTRRMYHKSHRMHMNTNLYQFSQTEPIPQVSMVDGTIPTNEYDNVDVTGEKFVPERTIYIKSKKSGLIFKTARSLNLYYKKAFSEYQEVDTLKPEIDGIVIRRTDLSIFLRTYEELLLNETKLEQEQKKESYRKLWRSAFKTMLSDPPSVAVQQHRKIRKVLGDSVTKFLNRLEHVT
uniref:Uncharacterized protein n=1 Tax=Babesia bovis TaxID=5865 RepID=A7AQV1_BABBO|eukprot:XP_001610488.1 hypothetical protein [Babesia bovis T2Bo]